MPNVVSLDSDRVTTSAERAAAGAPPAGAGRPQLRLVVDEPIRLAEPQVARIRGPKLMMVWLSLAAASWVVLGGMAYGLYFTAMALLG